jgi:RND family efflux transporter MFP subunit
MMVNWKRVVVLCLLGGSALVETQAQTTQPTLDADFVRGVIRPLNEAMLSTDLVARAVEMPYREGDSFDQGALLIGFDCARYQAEVAAAWAAHTASRKTYQTNQELAEYNAVGRNELEVSKAEMSKAAAEARAAETRMVDCELRAPFSGRVAERVIHTFETSAPGEPLMKIVDDTRLEIELVVPSRWLVWLKPGVDFRFHVDETGGSHAAHVTRLGGAVDPVSQTVKLFAEFDATANGVLSGMSGSAEFGNPEG